MPLPLLIYATSAFLFSVSAGISAAIIAMGGRGGSLAVTLAGIANIMFLSGSLLLLPALALLVLSFIRLGYGLGQFPKLGGPLPTAQVAWMGGLLSLVIAMVLGIQFFVLGGSLFGVTFVSFALVSGIAALAFLAAISLPAIGLTRGQRKGAFRVVGASVALGVIGVTGELAVMVLPPGAPLNWITFGGFPLLNWNLPFGLMVAASATLMAWSYRSIERYGIRMEARAEELSL